MKSWITSSLAVLVVILQLSAAFVGDGQHTDDIFGTVGAPHQLRNHEDASRCLHRAVGDFCFACIRHANVSTVVSAPPAPRALERLRESQRSHSVPAPQSLYYVSASKRGPPLS